MLTSFLALKVFWTLKSLQMLSEKEPGEWPTLKVKQTLIMSTKVFPWHLVLAGHWRDAGLMH